MSISHFCSKSRKGIDPSSQLLGVSLSFWSHITNDVASTNDPVCSSDCSVRSVVKVGGWPGGAQPHPAGS